MGSERRVRIDPNLLDQSIVVRALIEGRGSRLEARGKGQDSSVRISANMTGAYEEESCKRRLRYFDIARGQVKRLQTLLSMAVKVECLELTATTRARLLANEMDGWLKTLIKQSLKQG